MLVFRVDGVMCFSRYLSTNTTGLQSGCGTELLLVVTLGSLCGDREEFSIHPALTFSMELQATLVRQPKPGSHVSCTPSMTQQCCALLLCYFKLLSQRSYLRVNPVLPLFLTGHYCPNLEHAVCGWQHPNVQLEEFLRVVIVGQSRNIHPDSAAPSTLSTSLANYLANSTYSLRLTGSAIIIYEECDI